MENSEHQQRSTSDDAKELNALVDLVELSLCLEEEKEDSFVEYVHQLRKRFREKNPEAFRAKLIKGYRKLLDTVEKS